MGDNSPENDIDSRMSKQDSKLSHVETNKDKPKSNRELPPQTPKFEKRQMEAMQVMVQKKKNARQQAKEEERNFVEFRKLEILYNCRPTSAGAAHNRADDSFPRKRRGVMMGFGERKAHFLAVRPDPKYAIWFGKKSTVGKKKEKKLSAIVERLTTTVKPKEEKPKAEGAAPAAATVDDDHQLHFFGKKGNNSKSPLSDKGVPFWLDGDQEEELDDDDAIVNCEAIEKTMKHEIPMVLPPRQKTSFHAFTDAKEFKTDDVIFDRKVVFSNTIRSVLALSTTAEERQQQKSQAASSMSSRQPAMVHWDKNCRHASFSEQTKEVVFVEKPLKDVVKVADK